MGGVHGQISPIGAARRPVRGERITASGTVHSQGLAFVFSMPGSGATESSTVHVEGHGVTRSDSMACGARRPRVARRDRNLAGSLMVTIPQENGKKTGRH